MTFWQENYGFVKDVYDSRLEKYNKWMDDLDMICAKVMKPGAQYTYKEFKIIQDSLRSLTRDLEKEGMAGHDAGEGCNQGGRRLRSRTQRQRQGAQGCREEEAAGPHRQTRQTHALNYRDATEG